MIGETILHYKILEKLDEPAFRQAKAEWEKYTKPAMQNLAALLHFAWAVTDHAVSEII